MQVEEKIVEIFANHMESPIKNISTNTRIDSLGLYSLLFIQIIVTIEETYQIEFSINDLQAERFVYIQDCVDRVKALISKE